MTARKLMVAILLTLCTQAIAQTSFWTQSATPALPAVSSTASVTLGLKFYSDVAGSVTGIRFYKGASNTGAHTGALWSSTGTKLASVTFAAETASGWQQASFSSPVSIAANTTYVISYTAPNGAHAHDQYYSWVNLNASVLHTDGSAPGVYTYGSGVLFPTSAYNNSNYWVDVVFSPATPAPVDSQSSFWSKSAAPLLSEVSSTAAITVGLKFYSDVAGNVTGVRFYKGAHNTGTHVGVLWSSTGAKLASVNFSGETASGWQQVSFASPVAITPNTTYVISYLAPKGRQAQDQNYPWSSLSATPLHISGSSPCVHSYGANPTFPSSTWNNSNYWVDVVFTPSGITPSPDPAPSTYAISGKVSGSAATLTLSGAKAGSATTDSSGNYNFADLPNGSYTVVASQPGYTFTPSTASATINSGSITGLNFTSTAIPAPSTYAISGKVSGSAATLTLSGAKAGSATADSSGNYSFSGLPNGSYIVAASQSGYTFAPSSASATVNGASVTGLNFTSTAVPTPIPHSVMLSWSSSTSSNIAGYNVYRAEVAGGAFAKVNASPISTTSYLDSNVASGRTYYYVATAVDNSSQESTFSSQAIAAVPAP